MTPLLAKTLDLIWAAHHDRDLVAREAALGLSTEGVIELLAHVASARGKGWLVAKPNRDSILFEIGSSRIPAVGKVETLQRPANLIMLTDLDTGLSTDSQTVLDLWGAPLLVTATNLLLALQYARDSFDTLLYDPDGRESEIARVCELYGITPAILFAMATMDRQNFAGASVFQG